MINVWHRVADSVYSRVKAPRIHRRYHLSRIKVLLAALFLVYLFPAPGLPSDDIFPEQQFLKYDQDGVSVAFNNLRAADAAQWMRSTTGVAIRLPTSAQTKPVNLRLEGARVDYAVHSLLAALQLNNAFLVYDPDGHLTGVIALEKTVSRPSTEIAPAEENKQKTSSELTTQERESLLKEFARWAEISAEEQKSIQTRLKEMPPSKERDQLIKDYLRLTLGIPEEQSTAAE
jgi:hypothetical protein